MQNKVQVSPKNSIKIASILLICLSLFLSLTGCKSNQKQEIKVMQFNIWQEGTVVEKGYPAILDEVIRLEADVIALSEVRNYKGEILADRLVNDLKKRGYTFYSQKSQDSGILSRYPILSQEDLYPVKNDQGSVTKALIDINGTVLAFYSAHLDYRHCALYLPRSYDGTTWKKLDKPVTDTALIATYNNQSMRDEAIRAIIADASEEREKGRLVMLGGDLNEPSHLDWVSGTKDRYDHNGVVMEWPNTKALEKAGFIDAYRQQYPNALTHPGFTYPADNPLVEIKKLAWSPEADDRDRIDYIFYQPDKRLKLRDISIVGPRGSIARNRRVTEDTQDPIILPAGIWPTDHKAILATFILAK